MIAIQRAALNIAGEHISQPIPVNIFKVIIVMGAYKNNGSYDLTGPIKDTSRLRPPKKQSTNRRIQKQRAHLIKLGA